ncbi:MAG: hypothetical protein ACREUT_15525 [Steroidobacteraceae bacterium]
MLATEFAEFERELQVLEKLYSKQIDDGLMRLYFESLRDLPIGAIKRRILEHTRRSRFFPKPSELRPKDDRPVLSPEARASVNVAMLELARLRPTEEGHLRAAIALNERTWREFARQDPELSRIEYGIARVGRILVEDDPSSPQYAEAVLEDRRLRDQRQELLEARAR